MLEAEARRLRAQYYSPVPGIYTYTFGSTHAYVHDGYGQAYEHGRAFFPPANPCGSYSSSPDSGYFNFNSPGMKC